LVELKYADISFADVNNDNRIDMSLAGRYDFQDYRAYIYKNYFHLQNTPPTAPTNLSAIVDTCNVALEWSAGTDPDGSSLTYNLRIGTAPGTGNIFNGSVSTDGNRLVSMQGNMGTTLFLTLPCLPVGTYYAAVQSADHSYAVSDWSSEESFEIVFNGIKKQEEATLKLYPNPAKDYINIQIQNTRDNKYNFVIQDITGRQILEKAVFLNSGKITERIMIPQNTQPGTYFLKIETEKLQLVEPFSIIK
ncbi:MAG: T9SS type A sorting domain-containing protein, partial [Salinivirgaceae bacterium]